MPYTLTPAQKERAKQWYASTMCTFNGLRVLLKEFGDGKVMMQPELLNCAIVSWVIDEDRLIEFHDCDGLETHKSAAYFLYWFARLKPIQILSTGGTMDSRLMLINEIFAMFRVCNMLGIAGSKVIPYKFYNEMVYILRYRKFTAESIFPTIRLMEVAAKNGVSMLY